MANGPTLTTFHEWDVAGVKKGAAAIDAEYKKLVRTEQLVNRTQALNDAAQGRRMSQQKQRVDGMAKAWGNIGMGIRDAFEGRNAFAMVRFAKALGPAAIGIGAIAKTISYVKTQLSQANRETERLTVSFNRLGGNASFSSMSQGAGSLAGARQTYFQQIAESRENQQKLATISAMQSGSVWSGVNSVYDRVRGSNFMTGAFGEQMSADRLSTIGQQQDQVMRNAARDAREKALGALAQGEVGALLTDPISGGGAFGAGKYALALQNQSETDEYRRANKGSDPTAERSIDRKFRALSKAMDSARALGLAEMIRGANLAQTAGPNGEQGEFQTRRMELRNSLEKERAELVKQFGENAVAETKQLERQYRWLQKTVDAAEEVHNIGLKERRDAAAYGANPMLSPNQVALGGAAVAQSSALSNARNPAFSAEQRQSEIIRAKEASNSLRLARKVEMQTDVSVATSRAGLGIQGGGGSNLAKSLATANLNRQVSMQMINNPAFSRREQEEAGLSAMGSMNDANSALMERYLTPDGHRRRAHAVQRDFRNERNATRRRNAFIRRINRGEFNMETGRKASFLPMGGLQSGGLESGGLVGNQATGILQTIAGILLRGLPTEVAK